MRDGGLPSFSAAEYARREAIVDALLERGGVDALVCFGSGAADPAT